MLQTIGVLCSDNVDQWMGCLSGFPVDEDLAETRSTFRELSRQPSLTFKARSALSKLQANSKIELQLNRRNSKIYEFKDRNVFVGNLKNNALNGQGKMFLLDGMYCEGKWNQEGLQGSARIINRIGHHFEGMFKDFVAEGEGVYQMDDFVYEGNFSNNLQHGHGKQRCKGFQFQGEYQYGEKVYGRLVWKSGQCTMVYEGSFKDHQFEGKGMLIDSLGQYNGQFMANRRRGQGRQNYLNGTYYIGEFNNNSRNGFGTLYLQDGTIAQVGQWDYDLFVGK